MKKYIINSLLICAAAFAFNGCATAPHSPAWDYKVIYGNYRDGLETPIQKAAADGWEVVSSGGGDEVEFVILRRAK